MGCLVLLFALISPRLAIIATWLFSDVLGRAYDAWLVPVIGFFLLPWTTLAYAWLYDSGPGRTVEGWEWIVVGIAVLCDLGSLFGGSRSRR
jgi:uncharacterized BrkB/YihY/UPF0761 family membrane protein